MSSSPCPGPQRHDVHEFSAVPGAAAGGEEGQGVGAGEAGEVVLAAVVDRRGEEPGVVAGAERHGDGPVAVVGRAVGRALPDGAVGARGFRGAAVQALDQGTDQERDHGQDGDRPRRHVEDVLRRRSRAVADDSVADALSRMERDAREDRLDPRFFQRTGGRAVESAQHDDDGRGQGSGERVGQFATRNGAEVVGGRSALKAGDDGRRPGGVPLAVHHRRLARPDEVIAHGQHGNPDPPVTERVDASLRREQTNHRQPQPRSGRRDLAPRPEVIAPGNDPLTRRNSSERQDFARRADPRVGLTVLGPQDGVGPDRQRVAGRDVRGLARPKGDRAWRGPPVSAVSPPSTADGGQSRPCQGVGRADGVTVHRGPIERWQIHVGGQRFGQNQPQRLGERHGDCLARPRLLENPSPRLRQR